MPTIEEIVGSMDISDLKEDKVKPEQQPIVELPEQAIRWIAKKVSKDKYSDFEIARMANEKLAEFGLDGVGYQNPIKAKAHIARIRKAREKKLAQIQE